MAGELTIPDEFEDWPFEARQFVLAEANDALSLRKELDSLAGLNSEDLQKDQAGQFTKVQLATVVMALGGPNGGR